MCPSDLSLAFLESLASDLREYGDHAEEPPRIVSAEGKLTQAVTFISGLIALWGLQAV